MLRFSLLNLSESCWNLSLAAYLSWPDIFNFHKAQTVCINSVICCDWGVRRVWGEAVTL